MTGFAFPGFVIAVVLFPMLKALSVISGNAESQAVLLLEINSCSLQSHSTLDSFVFFFVHCYNNGRHSAKRILTGINYFPAFNRQTHVLDYPTEAPFPITLEKAFSQNEKQALNMRFKMIQTHFHNTMGDNLVVEFTKQGGAHLAVLLHGRAGQGVVRSLSGMLTGYELSLDFSPSTTSSFRMSACLMSLATLFTLPLLESFFVH